MIKGSKSVMEKVWDVQMDYGGDTEAKTLYVVHLAGWHMILGRPELSARNILTPVGPKLRTIQHKGMARFTLKE